MLWFAESHLWMLLVIPISLDSFHVDIWLILYLLKCTHPCITFEQLAQNYQSLINLRFPASLYWPLTVWCPEYFQNMLPAISNE